MFSFKNVQTVMVCRLLSTLLSTFNVRLIWLVRFADKYAVGDAFQCHDGSYIPSIYFCDGVANCPSSLPEDEDYEKCILCLVPAYCPDNCIDILIYPNIRVYGQM